MESNKILQADILDILFEDRNKEYGAYDLRKTYNRRLFKAMAATGSVILLLFVGGIVLGRGSGKVKPVVVGEVVLEEVAREKKVETPPAPPPVKVEPPKMAMIKNTPPLLVKEDVPEDEKPPLNTDLDDVRIGPITAHGVRDDGIVAPPVSDGNRGVVEQPVKKNDDGGEFVPVEVESTYPGGAPAWSRFLNKNLNYPEGARNIEVQGVVVVQFIVDDNGNVSNVTAVAGPEQGGLREEAVRVIRKSGKWVPALQNGRYVKSYKRQPITFQLAQE